VLGAGIAVSGALYFADRRMKSDDNHFRGFPGLWNIAAFYLFLLHWPPAASSLSVAALIALTFMPFYVVHPVRVVRLRRLTLCLIGAGTALAFVALICDFKPGIAVTAALCAIGLYIVGSDSAIKLVRSLNA
jgi:phosphatidylcholine synthase